MRNCVFQKNVNTIKWIKATLMRAFKTFCQTALSLMTVGSAITDLDWLTIINVSATAGVISVLTSIVGIPEVENDEKNNESL